MKLSLSTRPSPRLLLAVLLTFGGALGLLRNRQSHGSPDVACREFDGPCDSDSDPPGRSIGGLEASLELRAADACTDVGYLCAELEQSDVILLQRWKDFEGTLVVHIPLPESSDRGAARELQRAAALGLRQWSGRPFPILTDLRGDRNPHFTVIWREDLGGSQIGMARTQWSRSTGITVISIELASGDPFSPGSTADPRQIRLTAAHEMGHALGLPHSNAPRDVMYPTNTATSLSAQDYRTIEVLYRMENGTRIRR